MLVLLISAAVFCMVMTAAGQCAVRVAVAEGAADNNVIIGEYITTLEGSSSSRNHNISLACRAIDGLLVGGGEVFSFNRAVGPRVYDRGYRDAPVISDGRYIMGVGGGVCQVSTTLYNAWLLAGLSGVDVRHHTIPSHYTELSRDATVSEVTDMLLKNCSGNAVRISAFIRGEDLICRIYGKESEFTYQLISRIIEEIEIGDAPPVYAYVDNPADVGEVYYRGRKGYRSELVREKLSYGIAVDREHIREDYYPPQKGQLVEYRLREK